MGVYNSIANCERQYDIKVNCTIGKDDNGQFNRLGDVEKGSFEGDPDVAGIGIFATFVAVTSFALAVSILDLIWTFLKKWNIKKRLSKDEKRKRSKPSVSDILQSLVVSCSDTQVFMGGAYALTLRYYAGCTITAYHYNIVANMMLLTCGTHLMSITIVRNYWGYPFLALVRSLCIFGVFFVTGLLLANQNSRADLPFPTGLPDKNETQSLMFLPAVCFQDGHPTFRKTLESSFENNEKAKEAFLFSTPGNRIQGWNFYLVILLWYGVALIAEAVRFAQRGKRRPGWRQKLYGRLANHVSQGEAKAHITRKRRTLLSMLVKFITTLYLVGGVGISTATVVVSAKYMMDLRRWVSDSGWLLLLDNGVNPEENATTFGQLVPIFMTSMIVFTFLEMISSKITKYNDMRHEDDDEFKEAEQGSTSTTSPTEDPEKAAVKVEERPILLQQQSTATYSTSASLPSNENNGKANTVVSEVAPPNDDSISPIGTNTNPGPGTNTRTGPATGDGGNEKPSPHIS